MILCLGTTPAVQRVMVFPRLHLNEVNRAAATHDCCAGKSVNVAKVLHALGVPVTAIGFLGGDRGDYVRETLAARGIEQEFIAVPVRTRECITVIDREAGTHTELVEESQAVPAEDYEALANVLQRRLVGARALVLSGTLTPGAPVEFYRQAVERAHQAGAIALVDAQGLPLLAALTARPELIKPNRSELERTLARRMDGDRDLREAMGLLVREGARQVVVTAGAGALLAADEHHCWRLVPPAVRTENPVGSGDAFTAGLVWRLVLGEGLAEACRWGVAAGAANAATLLPGEVELGRVQRLVGEIRAEKL